MKALDANTDFDKMREQALKVIVSELSPATICLLDMYLMTMPDKADESVTINIEVKGLDQAIADLDKVGEMVKAISPEKLLSPHLPGTLYAEVDVYMIPNLVNNRDRDTTMVIKRIADDVAIYAHNFSLSDGEGRKDLAERIMDKAFHYRAPIRMLDCGLDRAIGEYIDSCGYEYGVTFIAFAEQNVKTAPPEPVPVLENKCEHPEVCAAFAPDVVGHKCDRAGCPVQTLVDLQSQPELQMVEPPLEFEGFERVQLEALHTTVSGRVVMEGYRLITEEPQEATQEAATASSALSGEEETPEAVETEIKPTGAALLDTLHRQPEPPVSEPIGKARPKSTETEEQRVIRLWGNHRDVAKIQMYYGKNRPKYARIREILTAAGIDHAKPQNPPGNRSHVTPSQSTNKAKAKANKQDGTMVPDDGCALTVDQRMFVILAAIEGRNLTELAANMEVEAPEVMEALRLHDEQINMAKSFIVPSYREQYLSGVKIAICSGSSSHYQKARR